jgi:hypothetical protein
VRTLLVGIHDTKPAATAVVCPHCEGRFSLNPCANAVLSDEDRFVCDRCARAADSHLFVSLMRFRELYLANLEKQRDLFALIGDRIPDHWYAVPRAARRRAERHPVSHPLRIVRSTVGGFADAPFAAGTND